MIVVHISFICVLLVVLLLYVVVVVFWGSIFILILLSFFCLLCFCFFFKAHTTVNKNVLSASLNRYHYIFQVGCPSVCGRCAQQLLGSCPKSGR